LAVGGADSRYPLRSFKLAERLSGYAKGVMAVEFTRVERFVPFYPGKGRHHPSNPEAGSSKLTNPVRLNGCPELNRSGAGPHPSYSSHESYPSHSPSRQLQKRELIRN
jgi:hypothetical protein